MSHISTPIFVRFLCLVHCCGWNRSTYCKWHFSAIGCSDLIPPPDAWLKRTDDEAIIGCYSTRLRWQLRCEGHQWIGVFGNCTQRDVQWFMKIMMAYFRNKSVVEIESGNKRIDRSLIDY